MESNVNLQKAIGKNIAIYPIKSTNSPNAFDLQNDIEGASFDFTASKFAWSISTKKSVLIDGVIVIEPDDTVIIFTNESISLDNSYAGACYCKLTFSMQGINHSSSPLKPGYTGRLSVSLHNDSKEPFKISLDSSIVVIMLDKLIKKANVTHGNGRGSRFDILTALKIHPNENERSEIAKYDDRKQILSLMKSEDNYKEFKKKGILRKRNIKKVIVFTLLVILCILSIIFKWYSFLIGCAVCIVGLIIGKYFIS